jgi:hypothetical protein
MTAAWKKNQDTEKLQKELDEQKAEIARLKHENEARANVEHQAKEATK